MLKFLKILTYRNKMHSIRSRFDEEKSQLIISDSLLQQFLHFADQLACSPLCSLEEMNRKKVVIFFFSVVLIVQLIFSRKVVVFFYFKCYCCRAEDFMPPSTNYIIIIIIELDESSFTTSICYITFLFSFLVRPEKKRES